MVILSLENTIYYSLLLSFLYGTLRIVCRFIELMYRLVFIPKNNFTSTTKYGQPANTWVIITGATDGIGWGYAEKFASLHYNIILVSRSLDKLNTRAQYLQDTYKVKTKVVEANFSKCASEKLFFEKLIKDCESDKNDIGILVNNVGLLQRCIKSASYEDTLYLNHVNTIGTVCLTNLMVNYFKKRQHKSAVIIQSSIAAAQPRDGNFHYSASKRLLQWFGLGNRLAKSESMIDWVVVRPGWVSTSMTKHRKPDCITCTTEDSVRGVLRSLGKKAMVYGAWKHECLGFIMEVLELYIGTTWSRIVFYDYIYKYFNKIMGVEQVDLYAAKKPQAASARNILASEQVDSPRNANARKVVSDRNILGELD